MCSLPDRFALPREDDKCTPYALVTFGGGPRLCIGVNFATIEVKALVVHVLRTFCLNPIGDQAPIQVGFTATVIPSGVPQAHRGTQSTFSRHGTIHAKSTAGYLHGWSVP